MQKGKTRTARQRWTGLQGVFDFEQNPSSPSALKTQLSDMSGYRVDTQSIVQPIWRRHHE